MIDRVQKWRQVDARLESSVIFSLFPQFGVPVYDRYVHVIVSKAGLAGRINYYQWSGDFCEKCDV